MTRSTHALVKPLLAGLALAALLAAPAGPGAGAEPLAVRAAAIDLNPERPGDRRTGALTFMGGLRLSADHPQFGGLSGFAFTDRAAGRFVAVTDRAHWFSGRLRFDAGERLVGIEETGLSAMRGLDGGTIPLKDHWNDAEAVERWDERHVVVAFERRHRLRRYPLGDDLGASIPDRDLALPAGLADVPFNGGIEGFAVRPDGRLLLLSEDHYDDAGNHAGWLGGPGDWQPVALSSIPPYKPTDLAQLADGSLLVLARRYSRLGGLGIMLRHVPADEIRAGGTMRGTVLADMSPPLSVDNMEGLDWRPLPDGRLQILLVSDDNFNVPPQRTLILAFGWRPGTTMD